MKHKTWFRLVLKAIGVYLICTAIPTILSHGASLIAQYINLPQSMPPGWSMRQQWVWFIPQGLDWAARIGIGLYLLLGGEWIVNKVIPSNRAYCPECGYDLTNARSERCPECGVMLPHERGESETDPAQM